MSGYSKNREKILAKNKEYYHKKKDDPDFYKCVLERNKEYYHRRNFKHPTEMTQEEKDADEAQMYRIIKMIRDQTEEDSKREKKIEPSKDDWALRHKALREAGFDV
jgi:hypothetical protein